MDVPSASESRTALRVLLFSDLLLDRPYDWAPPAVAQGRRTAAREALVELLGAARRHHADVVACAGDLFDRRTVRPSTVQWLTTALRSVNVPVLISPGNRDFIGPLGGYSDYDWSANVTVFNTERFTPVEVAAGVFIWGAAHTEAHRVRSFFFDGFRVDRNGVNLALFHGAERGRLDREPDMEQCAVFDEHAVRAAGFDHALVGHYPEPHFGEAYTFPGVPIAHDFGPRETGGAVLVTAGPHGLIDREFVPIASPALHDAEVEVTGAASTHEVRKRVNAALAARRGPVRLRLVGQLSPDIVVQRDDILRASTNPEQLVVDWNVQVEIKTDELAEEQTIRGQFVRDVLTSGELSEDRRQRILLIGLRALGGSDVLEAPR